ncbi:MAG: NPCBM/NEW2 domain-containing protein, partial [Thermoguttaceae bacterium]|nr:NPCBM/NEW2 domain-containing protein [Thermoguttaceae bacterium]
QGNIVVQLPKGKFKFSTWVGLDDEVDAPGEERGHMEFRICGDGKELWKSGYMTGNDPAIYCELELENVEYLVLYSDEGPEGYAFDHADWCDTKLETEDPALAAQVALVRPIIDNNGVVYKIEGETSRDYLAIEQEIQNQTRPNVAATAYNPEATIFTTDRDPLDVILRRTRALAENLEQSCDEGTLDEQIAQLNNLAEKAETVAPENVQERIELFNQVHKLRRTIAFKNPLLDSFSDILFIKRHMNPEPEREGNHMCDQFFGFHAQPGGGLFILKNAFADNSEDQRLVNVTENSPIENGRLRGRMLDSTWGFLSPNLTYDAGEIYFAAADTSTPRHTYIWNEDNCYHIFKIGLDGSHLQQLTDGAWNDFDPYYMPNGRLVFISERRGGYGRCHARPCPSYTLHSMNDDGSDIVALSVHETNEWAPSIDANGMIVYTRWDYVDRGFNQAHHPWITFPDGRDARAIQGNYSEIEGSRPHFETSLKQVPDSPKLVGIANNHHGQYFGSVILLDPTVEDDDTGDDPMKPIRRITPDQLFPESEIGVHGPPANYGQPYPLSEEYYLVVYDPFSGTAKGKNNSYGIYLLDVFGNKICIYRDSNISCQCPIPIMEREEPPVIPHKTLVGIPKDQQHGQQVDPEDLPKTGVVGVTNVYTSVRPFPEGSKAKELRIVQILPKTTTHANLPWIGYGAERSARRVLGTVPIEEDGSARFDMPVNVPVYFQVLDENGVAIQTMRSATYVHPGETLTCLGCHEGRHATAQNTESGNPIAFQRAPSQIKPDVPGSNPFNYPILVQNILDKHCVECHDAKAKEGKTFVLDRGAEDQHFFNSYINLRPYIFLHSTHKDPMAIPPITFMPLDGSAHEQFTPARTFPGQFGANASKLWKILNEGHYDVKLSPEEKRALALWMDNNADFYGA